MNSLQAGTRDVSRMNSAPSIMQQKMRHRLSLKEPDFDHTDCVRAEDDGLDYMGEQVGTT